MLKVECESCKAPYQVDERRVPPTGLKMRCPKCGHTFLVTDPSKGAPPAADGGGLPKPPPPKKATMVGLAPKPAPASTSAKAAPPFPQSAPNVPAAPGPQIPSLDFDAALPAVKPAAPPYKPPPGPSFASSKPTAPAMPAQQAPSPPPFGGLDDLDLPALAGDVGLPAAVHRPPPKPAPIAAPPPAAIAPPAAPAGPPKLDFEVDLPALPTAAAPPPPAPAAFAGGFGSLDLPAPKRPGQPDLPSAKPGGGGFGDLPMAKPGGFADLPSAAAGGGLPIAKAMGGGGFGEIDLPSLQNDLPQHSFGGGGNLPSAVGAGAHLPTAMGAGAHLPTAMGAGAHLPTAMGAGAHLPTAMGAGAHLPTAMSGSAHLPTAMGPNAHLPTSMGAGAHLPTAMGANAHMPQAVSDDRLLPNKQGGPGAIAFGELDLPLVGAQGGDPGQVLPSPANRGGLNFGEVDLPGDGMGGGGPSALPPPQSGGSAGGMGFGEVDLGGGDSSAPIGPPVAATGGNFPFKEASLDAGGPSATPGRLRPRSAEDRAPSKLPKIVGIAAAIIVVGGAALQFTPLGAFGYLWIGDKLHSGEQVSDATSKADFARKKLALDTFPSAVQAADDLLEARKRAPRSRPLGAYTAFCEYMNEVRFGIDPARAARVNTFLTEIPAEVEVPYLRAAQAAQSAQAGDWEKAKTAVDLAAAKEPKDGIQHELSILKGEIALAQRDPATALTAFNAAHASGGSARTFFGIARAHFMAKAYPKSREAVDNVIKASPSHAGAITLRGQLAWEMQRDDVAALKDITSVLADTNRKNLGPSEVSYALAAKGWIMFARDRAGEARAAFDEAVKIDPRNVSALVGQGEVLYADGRYTEALTRFDDAVSKDASSVSAILGSAKTKIALERLADSKAQLTAARQKWPKDMNVALWLARTEEALGNKKAAEELYSNAIDLGDPQTAEAIQAYAAYAKFLASQGKNTEAAAKLEQARSKLPDTAALQRAFGEVAAAQGQWEEALTHFDQALAKNPNDLGTRFRLGQAYRHMRRLDQAAKALDEVAAIDKDYPNLALERGLLFEQSGDVQKALEQFQSASQKAPNDIDLMLRVGAAYVAIGETEKALPLLLKVKDQRPNSAEANHFVGRAYLKQGGLESAAAMRYLQRAVALDPNRPEYHLYVAWAANEATPAQLGLARTHIDKALQLDKLLADGYWQRGVLERKEGQINDAIKDLKKALELKPSRHEAHATLAEAYQDKNDLAGAMSEWQKAIAGDDKPAYWRFRYGKLLADKNQNAEASKHLVYAVETGKAAQPRPGWLGSAAFEAGETLHKTGQKKEACEHYQLFMELAAPTSPDRRDAIKAMNELGCPYENR
ncbi:MAG: zinc-ribbon domain-containing protein [Deltaproteobacteria bacterium]|nr:zinc-ribbon domain-containing protein [Deltaproteobacteria bacterium]